MMSGAVSVVNTNLRVMASLTSHRTMTGRTSYYVKWYDRQLKKDVSQSFRDRRKAETLKLYLDANQNTLSLARKAKSSADRAGWTVWDAIEAHLGALRDTETTRKYRRDMNRHIQDTELAATPLQDLTAEHILDWLDGIKVGRTKADPEGRAAPWKTKNNLHGIVSAALKRQVGKRLEDNPARGVLGRRDELPTREPVDLTREELRLLRDRCHDANYALLIWVLTASGLRWSEATELRRKDLYRDAESGRVTLRVRRAFKDGKRVGLPKTSMSRRDVPLGLEVSAALWDRAAGLSSGALLFPGPDDAGQVLYNGTFHKRCWQPLTRKLLAEGLLSEKPWIHDLRHSHATHLLRAGRRPDVVQKRLGHEDLATTLKVYAMINDEDDLGAADAVDW